MSLKFNLPWDEFTFVRAYISIIFAIIYKECDEMLIAKKKKKKKKKIYVWIRFTDSLFMRDNGRCDIPHAA